MWSTINTYDPKVATHHDQKAMLKCQVLDNFKWTFFVLKNCICPLFFSRKKSSQLIIIFLRLTGNNYELILIIFNLT